MRRIAGPALFALSVAAVACGSSPNSAPKTAENSPATIETAPAAAPGATENTGTLSRAKVKRTIANGLGVFLQNVAVDDWPVMKDGKFYGFRLKAINPQWGVDLKPGDVVTRVNGMPIEHPEEADAALRALDKAPSLRVDFERDGKARILELPIVDDDKGIPKGAQEKRAQ
ncbi:hypothetical protein AKJ09_07603 [Labilithrix luteola]|uniref:PDZ domain-containing protein n=1 Tax=Labilithrix luteola TaxID=1391654 RepID=A0A0K1Q6A1_9BACT|nr:serine protease [Labilithrix luteola]AKV00940.1 hypothetical protein AKJ09_07603 [Labilithrix luteola]